MQVDASYFVPFWDANIFYEYKLVGFTKLNSRL